MKDKTERERQIFEAAYKVLMEKGFKSASMLAIAKAAGASNETMYNWYGNKQGLLAAMIKDNADQVASELEDFTAGPSGRGSDPVARLEKFGSKLLDLLNSDAISGRIAKDVFAIMFETGDDPLAIVEAKGLKQVTDTAAIEAIVDEVIAGNPGQVETYLKNPKVIGWFTGQVMKASGGKANPQAVGEILRAKLPPVE